MTDEELLDLDQTFEKCTQGEWHFNLMREGVEKKFMALKDPRNPNSEKIERIQKTDPRWDIYTGPEISSDEKNFPNPVLIAQKGRRQIMHAHPESPVIYEKCLNLNDAVFTVKIHNSYKKLRAEIERLRSELAKTNAF